MIKIKYIKRYLSTMTVLVGSLIFFGATDNCYAYDENGLADQPGEERYQPADFNEIERCYEISNVGQLYWFAQYINAGAEHIDASAKLMRNINIPVGFDKWIPIGIYSEYMGTFNGNGKTITGLHIKDNDAFIENLGADGVVQRMTLKDGNFLSYGNTVNGIYEETILYFDFEKNGK